MVRSVLDQSCRRRLHRHHADSQRSKRRFTPAEKAAMRAYALTPQKVNAYIAATNTLAAAKTSDRSVAQELEAISLNCAPRSPSIRDCSRTFSGRV
jgi:hypothetical protein